MKSYIQDYPQRMWINQPSTLQPYHNLHGINVLAIPGRTNNYYWVYFLTNDTNGRDIESMEVHRMALSDGWQTQSNINPGIIKRKDI